MVLSILSGAPAGPAYALSSLQLPRARERFVSRADDEGLSLTLLAITIAVGYIRIGIDRTPKIGLGWSTRLSPCHSRC